MNTEFYKGHFSCAVIVGSSYYYKFVRSNNHFANPQMVIISIMLSDYQSLYQSHGAGAYGNILDKTLNSTNSLSFDCKNTLSLIVGVSDAVSTAKAISQFNFLAVVSFTQA